MKYRAYFFFLLCIALNAFAQKGDSLLLNETKLTRPLNVHRNQFRISGAHSLAFSSAQFIGSEKIPSSESGRTRNFSGINLDIKYGITEHLQTRLIINRKSEVITEPAFFDGFGTEFYIFNTTMQKIGWEDPEIWIDYRIPFLGRKTDIVFNVGSSLPLMKSGAEQPTVEILPPDNAFQGVDFERLTTINPLSMGNGVARLGYGIQVKQRFKYWALNFQSTYYLPLGTETVQRWILTDNGTAYVNEEYERQIPDNLLVSAGIELQIRPWLNANIDGQYWRSQNGWNVVQEEKLLIPKSSLAQLTFGYEIIASKRLWIGQSLTVPLKGLNTYAPLLLTSSVQYNPFL